MYIQKRIAVRWAVFLVAFALTAGALSVREAREAARWEIALRSVQGEAVAELSNDLEALGTALRKASCAATPKAVSTAAMDAYGNALAAQSALGVIAYGDEQLQAAASFVSQAGDYAAFLVRSGGEAAEAGENLSRLADRASALAQTLTRAEAGILSGEGQVEGLLSADGGADFTEEIKTWATEEKDLPSLVYDGPFSDQPDGKPALALQGRQEVSEEAARKIAAQFTGLDQSALSLSHLREDELPVYVFTAESRWNTVTVEVTRQGGAVLYLGNTRRVGEASLGSEEAVAFAAQFLHDRGLGFLKDTYYEIANNTCLVNFAHQEGEAICYPDLVKVAVALDTGEVLGYESRGYWQNHHSRELPAPALTGDEAAGRVSPALEVVGIRPAVIPTAGGAEVYTWEVTCEDSAGRHLLVYLNAMSGEEEKILLLLESETGTLTV